MKKIIIENQDGGKEIFVPTEWKDVSLGTYVKIAKLEEVKSQFLFEEIFLLKVIEVLCKVEEGEVDELTIEQIEEIANDLKFLQDQNGWNLQPTIEIDGQVYVFPKDMNKLTMGEYISVKTFQEKFNGSADAIPYILAVILRKGIMMNGKWIQSRFEVEDLETRKNLFLAQSIDKMMGAVDFFLGGKKISMTSTEASIPKV
jgi:hypothetical protein